MTNEEYGRIISKNLKRIAYDHGKTQTEIAKDLGIKRVTISSWMNGTRIPKMDKIDILCNYFNVPRSAIMEEHSSDEEQPYYLNEETAKIAQEVYDNPDARLLLDASRNARPEDIRLAAEMLKRFKESNPDG